MIVILGFVSQKAHHVRTAWYILIRLCGNIAGLDVSHRMPDTDVSGLESQGWSSTLLCSAYFVTR